MVYFLQWSWSFKNEQMQALIFIFFLISEALNFNRYQMISNNILFLFYLCFKSNTPSHKHKWTIIFKPTCRFVLRFAIVCVDIWSYLTSIFTHHRANVITLPALSDQPQSILCPWGVIIVAVGLSQQYADKTLFSHSLFLSQQDIQGGKWKLSQSKIKPMFSEYIITFSLSKQ